MGVGTLLNDSWAQSRIGDEPEAGTGGNREDVEDAGALYWVPGLSRNRETQELDLIVFPKMVFSSAFEELEGTLPAFSVVRVPSHRWFLRMSEVVQFV